MHFVLSRALRFCALRFCTYLLVEGTPYLDLFDADRHCLFARDELHAALRIGTSWPRTSAISGAGRASQVVPDRHFSQGRNRSGRQG